MYAVFHGYKQLGSAKKLSEARNLAAGLVGAINVLTQTHRQAWYQFEDGSTTKPKREKLK